MALGVDDSELRSVGFRGRDDNGAIRRSAAEKGLWGGFRAVWGLGCD